MRNGLRLPRASLVLLAFVAAGLCAPAAPAASAPAEAPPGLAAEEYAVLARVITHGLEAPETPIVVAARTTGNAAVPERTGEPLAEYAEALGVTPELVLEWFAVNREPRPLGADPAVLGCVCRFMTESERAALFAADDADAGWARFFERYPDVPGFLRLSRPALDPTGTSALVYVEFHCGAECASGRLVHAAREPGGTWNVVGGDLVWMAAPP